MSRERLRYFKYYAPRDGRSRLVVYKSNWASIGLATLLFRSNDVEWLFSDFDKSLHRMLTNLKIEPINVLSWNGVAEIEDFRRRFPGVFVQSVITNEGDRRLFPCFCFQNSQANALVSESRIFFAGQIKPPRFFLAECSALKNADKLVADAPNLFSMLEIFKYVDGLAKQIELSDEEKDCLRMALSSVMRETYLIALDRKFGSKLILCGPDFDAVRFPNSIRIPYLQAEQTKQMYLTSRIALDFGSQCGVEALYPRSLEIIEMNPAALVQVRSRDAGKLFAGLSVAHDFFGVEEMFDCVSAVMNQTESQREATAVALRSNANALMKQ